MTRFAEIQRLTTTAKIELYVLDARKCGDDQIRHFCCGLNALGQPITWQGVVYDYIPIRATGYGASTKGVVPRPRLQVSALDGSIGYLVHTLDDMIGATITRKRVYAKYLDAVNFVGGVNPDADPDQGFDDDVYEINQKTYEGPDYIEFELVAKNDLQNMQAPRRKITRDVCRWTDATVCPYAVNNLCPKTLAGCIQHYGATAVLPFEGFLGVRQI